MMTNVAIFVMQYELLGVVMMIGSIAYVLIYYCLKYGVETGARGIEEGCANTEDEDTWTGCILTVIFWPVVIPRRLNQIMNEIDNVLKKDER